MPLDMSWIDDLAPDQAQASLDNLAEFFRDGMSVREAVELHKMRKKLQAKVDAGGQD
jgi:hypothetical protein